LQEQLFLKIKKLKSFLFLDLLKPKLFKCFSFGLLNENAYKTMKITFDYSSLQDNILKILQEE